MLNFDYISSKELQQSLESDYAELEKCVENAWKSAHVIAGSIVEALLIDYIDSTPNPARKKKNPLHLDLSEAVEICRSEGVISQRTADLCSVIKSYRNLIHPGRMVRLNEPAPSLESSSVSFALVKIIADELEKARRKTVGLTAEQLLTKIQRDRNAPAMIKHLLPEIHVIQRERLLRDLIPDAYSSAGEDDFEGSAERLKVCYRQVLETLDDDARKRIAQKFVDLVRTADDSKISEYASAFFLASDIAFVADDRQDMIKDHLLIGIPPIHTAESVRLIDGIGPFLKPADSVKWVDAIIKTYVSTPEKQALRGVVYQHALEVISETTTAMDKSIFRRFDDWIRHYEKLDRTGHAEATKSLKADMEGQITPF